MILKEFEYSEFEGQPNAWTLKGLSLEKVNLLVGKNATGKTRTLNAINTFRLLTTKPLASGNSNYRVEFIDDSTVYKYSMFIIENVIQNERLLINEKEYITRDSTGKGTMLDINNQSVSFKLPENYLAISKRDLYSFQYLEKIYEWAQSILFCSFASSMKQEIGTFWEEGTVLNNPSSLAFYSDVISNIFLDGHLKFGKDFKRRILESMKKIDYTITDINLHKIKNTFTNMFSGDDYELSIKEDDHQAILTQNNMSQGMFSALSLIIQITYNILIKSSAVIIIDDIGEGLDFDRSTKLIKLLIELAEQNDTIQLIMSTNDRFVMNAVPLKYWQLIQRKGGECQVFNYKNSKEKFDEFEYMGLNNFDFLATDFINSKWEKV